MKWCFDCKYYVMCTLKYFNRCSREIVGENFMFCVDDHGDGCHPVACGHYEKKKHCRDCASFDECSSCVRDDESEDCMQVCDEYTKKKKPVWREVGVQKQ